MRAALIAIFIISVQFGLALMNAYTPYYTAYPGMRVDFNTGEFYAAEGYNFTAETHGTTSFDSLNETYGRNLTGNFNFGLLGILEMASAAVTLLFIFLSAFVVVYQLLTEFYVPPLLAIAVQAGTDIIFFYGLAQWIMGRSGKSME